IRCTRISTPFVRTNVSRNFTINVMQKTMNHLMVDRSFHDRCVWNEHHAKQRASPKESGWLFVTTHMPVNNDPFSEFLSFRALLFVYNQAAPTIMSKMNNTTINANPPP